MEAGRRRFGPIAPPPGRVVRVPASEAFVVPAVISREDGAERAREAIQEGFFRPVDSHKADIEGVQLVWVPLWRIDAATVTVLLARKDLPFDPAPAVALDPSEMVPRASHAITEGEVLEPDVARDEAEREAVKRASRRSRADDAGGVKADAAARATTLVHYPVWLRRYTYAGQAAKGEKPEECHVAISARTGKVVSARHPSALRSFAGRVRKLFRR